MQVYALLYLNITVILDRQLKNQIHNHREPENIEESLRMYKLQPVSTVHRNQQDLNQIETVESITCKISEKQIQKRMECLC